MSLSSTLPGDADIGSIAGWLREAGLEGIEITTSEGSRLHITLRPVGAAVQMDASGELPDMRSGVVTVTAPFFGRLCLSPPLGGEPFALPGHAVRAGDLVALLTVRCLQIPVLAPVDGTVVEVVARAGDLVGYGATILVLT